MTAEFPFYTPYQFAGNKPIQAIDLDGLEEFEVTGISQEKGTVYGPYSDQQAAQSAADNGTADITYDLPEYTVSAPREDANDGNNIGLSTAHLRGGSWASGYNGVLRLGYVYRAKQLESLYTKGNPKSLNNVIGAYARYRFKENARALQIGGRAHLDFVDPNGLKYGTRFFRSNIYVNGFGAAGVAFGVYHVATVGSTLLTLDTAGDRLSFATGEGVRSLAAVHQMKLASYSYKGLSIRFGLSANRTRNIFGSFIYSGLRGSVGSAGAGFYFEGLLNNYRILGDSNTAELWNRTSAKNPYSGFVIGNPNVSFFQWLSNSKK